MDLGLSGKHALVTGASKGIGLAITSALVAEGAHVVAGTRSVSDELRQLIDGGQVRQVGVDLSTTDGPSELVASALEDGPLDVLVNNVGAVTPQLDGFLSVYRRSVAAVAHVGVHGGRAHDPRGAAEHARGYRRRWVPAASA
jgi:NAD(P)-dependent dehydrogenase (short-subunit alcohol dehydrogenase family)